MICLYVCMAVGQIPRSPLDMKIAGSPGSEDLHSLWHSDDVMEYQPFDDVSQVRFMDMS